MGNLSNLYISRSFQSLIHLGSDSTATNALTVLQDGYGNSIGIEVNTGGNLYLSGSLTASLQNGYMYVGNANGKTTTIATSSLVTNVNTGSLVTTSSFNTYTASQNTINNNVANSASLYEAKFANIGAQSGSWGGGGGTGSVPAGTVSSSAQILAYNIFATTGSNTFAGNQTIAFDNGEFRVTRPSNPEYGTVSFGLSSASGGGIQFKQSGSVVIEGAPNDGRITFYGTGSFSKGMQIGPGEDYGNNLIIYPTGSRVALGGPYEGGLSDTMLVGQRNSSTPTRFTNVNVTIDKNLLVTGSFTSSLQQGYLLVGNENNITTLAPTSSFITNLSSLNQETASLQAFTSSANQRLTAIESVSGSWITESETSSFARTNINNNFTANQTINGNLIANKVSVFDFDSLFYGSQMGGTTANGTFFGYGSTDYTQTIGAYAGGFDNELQTYVSSAGIELRDFNGASYPSFLKLLPNTGTNPAPILTRGVEITGSVKLTPASVSTSAQYPLIFVSGSTLSKDSVDTLVYNPSTNQLIVSASATGQAQISPNAIIFTSGSGAFGTYASTVSKAQIQSAIEGSGVIGISGNPSKIGAPSLTNFTKPGIIALSGSGVPYVAIELENSASFTDGRVTAKRKLVGQQGFELTGSFTATIPTASSESQINLFNFAPFVGANGTTYTSANISLQDYASSGIDQNFVVEYANASFEKYTALTVGPTTGGSKAQFAVNTGTGYDYDEISITDNGGGLSTALIKADTNRIVGTTQITGSLGVSSNLTIASGSGDLYVYGHKQFNCGGFQTNITQSGSANVSQSVNFEVTDVSYGVTIASNSRITLANDGVYSITFSAQLKADAGADTVYMWLKKNGTNVPESATKLALRNNEEGLMTVNFMVEGVANDYFEIAWQSTNGDAVLYAENASGNIPAIPSVIVTAIQVR